MAQILQNVHLPCLQLVQSSLKMYDWLWPALQLQQFQRHFDLSFERSGIPNVELALDDPEVEFPLLRWEEDWLYR